MDLPSIEPGGREKDYSGAPSMGLYRTPWSPRIGEVVVMVPDQDFIRDRLITKGCAFGQDAPHSSGGRGNTWGY